MKTYPYLRAYMAGITVPTFFLLLILSGFTVANNVFDAAISIERVIVFPMAIVPNLWGLWNVLYVRLRRYRYLPIGFHGALLAFVQAFFAFVIAGFLDFEVPQFARDVFPIAIPVIVVVFYLVWKHLVAFFNAILGIE